MIIRRLHPKSAFKHVKRTFLRGTQIRSQHPGLHLPIFFTAVLLQLNCRGAVPYSKRAAAREFLSCTFGFIVAEHAHVKGPDTLPQERV